MKKTTKTTIFLSGLLLAAAGYLGYEKHQDDKENKRLDKIQSLHKEIDQEINAGRDIKRACFATRDSITEDFYKLNRAISSRYYSGKQRHDILIPAFRRYIAKCDSLDSVTYNKLYKIQHRIDSLRTIKKSLENQR